MQFKTAKGGEREFVGVIEWWPSSRDNAKQRAKDRYYARLRKARRLGTHTKEEWSAILEKHGHRCARCGIPASELIGGTLCKDHIIALMEGGSDSASNLQPLCRGCNTAKRFEKK